MDKYQKIRIIGRGAFGTVHLCTRTPDNQYFIIKEIPVDQMTTEERQSSLNEAKVLSMLDHPNIVAYHENFLSDNTIVIVMEYVEGGTLYKYLQERNANLLSETEAMHIFSQLVVALQCVHSHWILHRDLKSQNILLNKNKTIAKIGDFGISKILSSKSKAFTVVGTPYYISPELCEGKPYNQKSDIWALGCILYELLTLKRPFEGDNLPALVMKIMQGNFDPIPDVYDRNIKQLVMNMLNLDPIKRPTANQIMVQPFMVGIFYQVYMNFGCLPCSSSKDSVSSLNDGPAGNSSKVSEQSVCKAWFISEGDKDPVQLPMPSVNTVLKCMSIGGEQIVGVASSSHIVTWKSAKNSSSLYMPFVIDEKFAFDVVSVFCGQEFSICLTKSGVVSVWGSELSDCLGCELGGNIHQPKILEALFGFNVISAACGPNHAVAVSEDHDVFSWGHGDKGCLGLGKLTFQITPKLVHLSVKQRVIRVFCGPDSSFALTDKRVLFACGSNRHNKLGMDTEDGLQCDEVRVLTPVRSDPLPSLRVESVSVGINHTAVLTDKGKIYTFGCNRDGQLGWGPDLLTHNMPGLVVALRAYVVTQVSCGNLFTLAVTEEGYLYAWGKCPAALRDQDYIPVQRVDESLDFLENQSVSYVCCNENNCAIVAVPKKEEE